MNKCLKCGHEFKNRVKINGSIKILNRRKYCLECSPFGQRNTKRLHLPQRNKDSKKQCPQCGRNFKWNKNNICWTCRSFNRRKFNRNKGLEYLGNKCTNCGIDDQDVLTFHHKNRKKKKDNLSSLWHNNWKEIKQELDICELLCANCHMKLHRKENNE
jgi:hypothetical protein